MIIDFNVTAGTWPFRPVPDCSPADLETRLRNEGISTALVSSAEAVLNTDPEPANSALLQDVKHTRLLRYLPVLNLSLPTWPAVLREYLLIPETAGVKLHPSYHGWKLTGPEIQDLASIMEKTGKPLVISARMEDERLHYFRMKVPPEPADPLRDLADRFPELNIIILNLYLAEIKELSGSPSNLYTDIAFAETLYTLENVLTWFPADQVLFGSHTPFFVTLAAKVKVLSSGMDQDIRDRIFFKNGEKLLAGVRK
ncbi:MAG: amidohydrolase family protein [Spirochaetia bacterium]